MSHSPKLSVCIPAYDMGGQGVSFLTDSFERLATQSLDDFEVVVSDQSDDDAIEKLCKDFADRLCVRHVYFTDGKRQASANCNNAMRHASGEVVKILFQDDLVAEDGALAAILRGFESGADWLLTGSAVTRDGVTAEHPMVPRLHPQIRFGKNTVSSPSVLAMRRDSLLNFDEDLIWLMDVDIYDRLQFQCGRPAILPEVLVWNRLHAGQVSAGVTKALRRKELTYVRAGTLRRETWQDFFEYLKQMLKALL